MDASPDRPILPSAASEEGEALALREPDWLAHTLAVSGPVDDVARFRAAARGALAIPWHVDFEQEEARLYALMAAGGGEARALARDLREAAATHHERVLAQVAEARVCPLDLHRLVPVPGPILRLGRHASESRLWLWRHWGTLRPLRRVRALDVQAGGRLHRSARFVVAFESADWTPWPAILRLRQDWRLLAIDVRPEYGHG